MDVDAEGRCAHYAGPNDVVAIRLPCCGRYYACHACHEALAGHPARPWPRDRFEAPAVLCGVCRRKLAVAHYLASPDACSHCGAPFNPRCRRHHFLYFEVETPAGAG